MYMYMYKVYSYIMDQEETAVSIVVTGGVIDHQEKYI